MPRVTRRRLLVALVALVAADQVCQHTVLRDDQLAGVPIAPFDPPLFAPYHRERLADLEEQLASGAEGSASEVFDAELGWCPRPGGRGPLYSYDWAGARTAGEELQRVKDPERQRILLIGCSFTRGDEVPADQTWAHLLGVARPDVELANLGMGGFGIDQAYLRFRRDGLPLDPDEVWLGLLPAAMMRVTTSFPPLLRHWAKSIAFKPRYLVDDDDELRLVPSPVAGIADFVGLMHDQRALLGAIGETDLWIRRAPLAYAPRGSSWTHDTALGRILLTLHEKRARQPAAWFADPESEPYRVVRALLRRLQRETAAEGRHLRILVLPGREDLRALADGAPPYWAGLLEDVAGETGVEVLDTSPALIEAGALDGEDFWMPGGHYSPRANRVVAEALQSSLER